MLEVKELFDGLFVYDNGRVRAFLIKGDTSDLLIDTMFEKDELILKIKQKYQRPLDVLLTHNDLDHIGGLTGDYQACFVHLYDLLEAKTNNVFSIAEGEHLQYGSYDFEVIHIPGHTKGSIALFDKSTGILISGDSVQKDGPIYMFGDHRDFDTYIESLKKLHHMSSDVKIILPSHNAYPLDSSYIEKNLSDAIALKEGRLPHEKTPNMPCDTYHGQYVDFYY